MSVLDLCIKIATEFVETGIQLRFTQKKGEEKQEYKECKKKSVPPGISLGSVVNNLPWMICVCVLVVTQLCLILCKSMDCIQPGSSVHGDSPGKNTGVGYHSLLQGIFPTQGPNPGLPHCRWILYCLSHQGSPKHIKTHSFFCILQTTQEDKRSITHRMRLILWEQGSLPKVIQKNQERRGKS